MFYILLIMLTCMTHEGERDWRRMGASGVSKKETFEIRERSVTVTVKGKV